MHDYSSVQHPSLFFTRFDVRRLSSRRSLIDIPACTLFRFVLRSTESSAIRDRPARQADIYYAVGVPEEPVRPLFDTKAPRNRRAVFSLSLCEEAGEKAGGDAAWLMASFYASLVQNGLESRDTDSSWSLFCDTVYGV